MVAGAAAGMWIVSGVLGWAGIAKVLHPESTRTALRLAGLPAAPWTARLLGVIEIMVTAAVLTTGGHVVATALAAVYGALTVFSYRSRRVPGSSCGCFGDTQAPLTGVHVGFNAVATVVAGWAAVLGAPGLVALSADNPVLLLTGSGSVVAATGVVTMFLTTVPTLAAVMRSASDAAVPEVGTPQVVQP